MDFSTWLEAERGRLSATAAHFGKSLSAISQWKTNGVPVDLMKAVRDFSGGEVTLEEMLPPAPAPVAAAGAGAQAEGQPSEHEHSAAAGAERREISGTGQHAAHTPGGDLVIGRRGSDAPTSDREH